MDTVTARLECLKLAVQHASICPPGFQQREMPKPEGTLAVAESWAKFVIGPDVMHSKSSGKKGADEK